jgi:hypothetical protein
MARLIGVRKVPTTSDGGGVWGLNEQAKFRKDGVWPTLVVFARYWRLLFSEGFSSGHLDMAEIELMSSVGGVDITPGKTVTASSYDSAPYSPDKVIDDNLSTAWHTAGPFPLWIKFDMTSSVSVVEYSIRVRNDTLLYTPKSWTFEYSNNDTDWISLHSVSNSPSWSLSEKRTYNGFN